MPASVSIALSALGGAPSFAAGVAQELSAAIPPGLLDPRSCCGSSGYPEKHLAGVLWLRLSGEAKLFGKTSVVVPEEAHESPSTGEKLHLVPRDGAQHVQASEVKRVT